MGKAPFMNRLVHERRLCLLTKLIYSFTAFLSTHHSYYFLSFIQFFKLRVVKFGINTAFGNQIGVLSGFDYDTVF